MTPDRRQFLALGIGAFLCKSESATLEEARASIRAGELGEVRFCRIFSDRSSHMTAHLRTVEFALDCGSPVSITAQGNGGDSLMATVRYPRCIVSYESRRGMDNGITFHGALASLRVSQ